MGEVLIRFTEPVRSASGREYEAQACGDVGADRLWEGWIEFQPLDGGEPLRGPRETQQPTHTDLQYWAGGLTMAYLEGALQRGLGEKFGTTPPRVSRIRSRFDAPVARTPLRDGMPMRAVLDPFAVYSQGENVLRNQLRALSRDQIETVVEAFGLREQVVRNPLAVTSDLALADEVVTAVRRMRAVPGSSAADAPPSASHSSRLSEPAPPSSSRDANPSR